MLLLKKVENRDYCFTQKNVCVKRIYCTSAKKHLSKVYLIGQCL